MPSTPEGGENVVPALLLVVLGSVSFTLLILTLVQSTSTGSVDVALLGMDLGNVSTEAATLVFAGAVVVSAGAGLLGALLLIRRRAGSRSATSIAEREKLAETELEARARLLEYRIQTLTEQMTDLDERRHEATPDGQRPPLVPGTVEPRLVPGRRPPERPLKAKRKTKPDLQLVVLPVVAEDEVEGQAVAANATRPAR